MHGLFEICYNNKLVFGKCIRTSANKYMLLKPAMGVYQTIVPVVFEERKRRIYICCFDL